MNVMLIIAGLLGAFTTIGHFAMGSKLFLHPMLAANFDAVPKKVMHCVFHYVSAFLILSTAALFAAGFGAVDHSASRLMVRFIAVNYALFAIWQITLALGSGIPRPLSKLFQWTFFILVAVFAFAGS